MPDRNKFPIETHNILDKKGIDLSECLPPGISLEHLRPRISMIQRRDIDELNAVFFSKGGVLAIYCAAVTKENTILHPPCESRPHLIGDLWENQDLSFVMEYKRDLENGNPEGRGVLTIYFVG